MRDRALGVSRRACQKTREEFVFARACVLKLFEVCFPYPFAGVECINSQLLDEMIDNVASGVTCLH